MVVSTITATSLIHTCTIQKRHHKQKLTYKTGTGAFTVGLTVTGGTSHATGIIDRKSGTVATGYLILKTVSGTFQNNEPLTDTATGAAVADGANADYYNDSREPEWYWANDQTSVPCKFYFPRSGYVIVHDTGERIDESLKMFLNPSVTIDATNYRIVSTETEFTGTFIIEALYAMTFTYGIHHYELTLKAAT